MPTDSIPSASNLQTAIPPRFQTQRERVLRILARWEMSTLGAALTPVGPR